MKKIILTSVCVGLLLCIGIATLIMALIPVGLNEQVQVPNQIYIYCAKTKTDQLQNKRLELKDIDGQSDIARINKMYNLFNDAFPQKALTALFNGELKQTTELEYIEGYNTISKNTSSEDKFTIVFKYDNPKELKVDNKTVKAKYLFFEIDNEDARKDILIGITASDNAFSDEESYSSINVSYNFCYKAKANFANLYNYAAELVSIFD